MTCALTLALLMSVSTASARAEGEAGRVGDERPASEAGTGSAGGWVTHDGWKTPAVEVRVYTVGMGRLVAKTRSSRAEGNTRGSFRFRSIPSGEYEIVAFHPDLRGVLAIERVHVVSPRSVRLRLDMSFVKDYEVETNGGQAWFDVLLRSGRLARARSSARRKTE